MSTDCLCPLGGLGRSNFTFLLNSCKAAIENARVKLEDAIEIDTVDEVPQTPRTAEPRTAEPTVI